jgi:hypothetical protein
MYREREILREKGRERYGEIYEEKVIALEHTFI